MTSTGGLPLDLILFGMIAVFLILRLRSILGRRTGFERGDTPPTADAGSPRVIESRPVTAAAPRDPQLPDPASPLGQALQSVIQSDPNFSPVNFLTGAENAFRMIVTAYAQGDRATLRPLLSESCYQAFDGAITAREQAGETQTTEIKAISAITYDQITFPRDASGQPLTDISVRIVSDQTNLQRDRANTIISGFEGITEIVDIWTFERPYANPQATWRLSSARSG